MSRLERIHPFFWFLRDSPTFFATYAAYRNKLLRRLRREALAAKPVHVRLGLWKRALAAGLTSFRRHGRAGIPSLRRLVRNRGLVFPDGADFEQVLDPWREPAEGDAVHSSPRGDRRYVWRREVLTAEPREEISITPDETARVEQELDCYRLVEAPDQAE